MTDVQSTQTTQDAPATPDTQAVQATQAAQNAQAIPSNPDLASKSDPLDDLIAAIRTAVAPGASAEARTVGATACRAILTGLEAKAGQPLTAAPPATSPLAAMLTQLAAMPREQMLEFITSFLRSKLPPGAQPQVTAGPRFHLIQLPQVPAPQRR